MKIINKAIISLLLMSSTVYASEWVASGSWYFDKKSLEKSGELAMINLGFDPQTYWRITFDCKQRKVVSPELFKDMKVFADENVAKAFEYSCKSWFQFWK